ncbi:MAG: hypothetical protein JRN42_07415 [Nitrososphaerota archaeon]|nr:hypothetical protein [Nitrososphaerota archaeon]
MEYIPRPVKGRSGAESRCMTEERNGWGSPMPMPEASAPSEREALGTIRPRKSMEAPRTPNPTAVDADWSLMARVAAAAPTPFPSHRRITSSPASEGLDPSDMAYRGITITSEDVNRRRASAMANPGRM